MYTSLNITSYLSAGVLLAVFVLTGCGGANGADEAPTGGAAPSNQRSLRVETLTLAPTTFEDVIELTGTVESVNDATLSAQASGTVEYLAPLGRNVGQGAVVARLDPGLANAAVQQAEAQVEAAQAQFELAEDNFQRQEPLYRDSVISALEYQNARAQFNQAQAGLSQAQAVLAQARKQLQNTLITAPFPGSVEAHFVEQGEQIAPSAQVLRIVDTRRMKVSVGVPERYASDIEAGTSVLLDFQAYRGQPRRGTVTFVGSAIDPQSRTFPVEVEVPNEGKRLKPEMITNVLISRESIEDAIVVPRPAILRDEHGTSVFVVQRAGGVPTAERRAVVLGSSYSGQVVVTSGLEAGEEVLVLGQNNVTEGDALEIIETYSSIDAAGVPMKEAGTSEEVLP